MESFSTMKTFSHTITNQRDNLNKDRFLIKEEENWFTICDGVSANEEAGAKAAQIAIDGVKNTNIKDLNNRGKLKSFVEDLGKQIKTIGGATTFTSIFLKPERNKAILFHTGDSECYFVYDNSIIKEFTIPTSLAYQFYKNGKIPKENIKNTPHYSNVLLECLNGKPIELQITELSLKNVTHIILCTDGVNYVSPEMMASFLSSKNPAKTICEKALELKSKDDITCVVIKF